jgi:hypothetical protein
LLNSDGDPWTADGFRSSWRKACAAAGIVGAEVTPKCLLKALLNAASD